MSARLRHSWPGGLLQTDELRPDNAHAVLLDWTEQGRVDAGVPGPVALAVAAALVRLGPVAFRWDGDPPEALAGAGIVPPPAPGLLRSLLDRAAGRWQSGIALTRRAEVAVALFDHGWELQGQAALVLREGAGTGDALRSGLATRREWRDFAFGPDTLVLLAPAVDGDAAMFATASGESLRRVLGALRAALGEAGIPLVEET